MIQACGHHQRSDNLSKKCPADLSEPQCSQTAIHRKLVHYKNPWPVRYLSDLPFAISTQSSRIQGNTLKNKYRTTMVSLSRTLLQRALTPACRWTPELVQTLGVYYANGHASRIIVKPKDLPKNTRDFLDESIAAIQSKDNLNYFFRMFDNLEKYEHGGTHGEYLVDNLIEELMKRSISDNRLDVVRQYGLQMEMNGKKLSVKPDLVISQRDGSRALMVVENKKPMSAPTMSKVVSKMMKTRSQALAQAIAARQQETWPQGFPSFMMTNVGPLVMFYESLLDEGLLHRVKTGREFQEGEKLTTVTEYAKGYVNGRPVPWDIANPDDLVDVVGVFAHINTLIARRLDEKRMR